MKKFLLIALSLLLVLFLAAGAALWLFISRLPKSPNERQTQPVEDYLAESWPAFSLAEYDEGAGRLVLEKTLSFTLAQAEKYGAAAGLQELAEGHLDTLPLILSGVQSRCGVELREVLIRGVTTDGGTAYTVSSDGSVEAVWEAPQ